MQKASIKNWDVEERPREKMLSKGINALTNAELLAIIINNGTKNQTAVDVARQMLHVVNNDLSKLGKLSVKEITNLKIKGLGPAKAISIAAALELGNRRTASFSKKTSFSSSSDVVNVLKAKLQYIGHEVFYVLFLNRANKLVHEAEISRGGITGTVVDPRIVLKMALDHSAVSIILCHNHPSGNLKPSRMDEEITKRIKEAARLLDISVIDHVIVSEEGYFSFADEGIL